MLGRLRQSHFVLMSPSSTDDVLPGPAAVAVELRVALPDVVITRVMPQSPAERAGLRTGDVVARGRRSSRGGVVGRSAGERRPTDPGVRDLAARVSRTARRARLDHHAQTSRSRRTRARRARHAIRRTRPDGRVRQPAADDRARRLRGAGDAEETPGRPHRVQPLDAGGRRAVRAGGRQVPRTPMVS